MNPEAVAALIASLEQFTPGSVLAIVELISAFQSFFQRGSEEECWTLVRETFRLPTICHCVGRQALRVSQQREDEPQGVKPHAGRKPRTDATPLDTAQAMTQANAAAIIQADSTEVSAAQGNTTQGKKRRKPAAKGRSAKTRTARERAPEETTPESARAAEVIEQYLNSKGTYSAEQLKNLRYIATGLTEVQTLSPEDLERIWADDHESKRSEFSGIAPDMEYTTRAYMLYKNMDLTEHEKLANRYKQRFVALLYGHEIDQIIRTRNFTRSRGRDGKTLAFDDVARVYEIERDQLIKMYQRAKIYLQCAKSGGAGTLLSMKNLISYWMRIPFEDIHELLSLYRKKGLPAIEKQSRCLDDIAKKILLRGCAGIGLTDAVIAERGTPLTSWIHDMTGIIQSSPAQDQQATLDGRIAPLGGDIFTYATDITSTTYPLPRAVPTPTYSSSVHRPQKKRKILQTITPDASTGSILAVRNTSVSHQGEYGLSQNTTGILGEVNAGTIHRFPELGKAGNYQDGTVQSAHDTQATLGAFTPQHQGVSTPSLEPNGDDDTTTPFQQSVEGSESPTTAAGSTISMSQHGEDWDECTRGSVAEAVCADMPLPNLETSAEWQQLLRAQGTTPDSSIPQAHADSPPSPGTQPRGSQATSEPNLQLPSRPFRPIGDGSGSVHSNDRVGGAMNLEGGPRTPNREEEELNAPPITGEFGTSREGIEENYPRLQTPTSHSPMKDSELPSIYVKDLDSYSDDRRISWFLRPS